MGIDWRSCCERCALLVLTAVLGASSAMAQEKPDEKVVVSGTPPSTPQTTAVPDSITEGAVTVGGQSIAYKAVAGTLTVGATDAQDATIGFDGKPLPDSGVKPPCRSGASARDRPHVLCRLLQEGRGRRTVPITFIYNGGTRSPSHHVAAPRHLRPPARRGPDTEHQEGAPYTIVNNQYSLLDVSDVVFIDAPGTGLSRTFGKDKAKAFYGVDGDGHAFERSFAAFCTKYGRWNSPKYLFGESYGTPRSAVFAADLRGVDSMASSCCRRS